MPSSSANTSYNESQSRSQNQAQNQAQNTASSQSTSGSFIPEYSQTPILERIAQHAESMAPQAYNWGMNRWASNQGDINKLMNDADRYEGQPQQAVDMGAAEAAVTGAGEAGRQNAVRDLQDYGIDPSSGRYAALDKADRVKNAAAAAGAGNVQRNADMARANTERNQAISAELQNSSFGNQVGNTANAFLGTAMRLPYSPLGTQSQSSSQSQGSSSGSSSGSSTSDSFGGSVGGSSSVEGGGVSGSGGGVSGGGSKGGGNKGGDQSPRSPTEGQGGPSPYGQPTYPQYNQPAVDDSGPGYSGNESPTADLEGGPNGLVTGGGGSDPTMFSSGSYGDPGGGGGVYSSDSGGSSGGDNGGFAFAEGGPIDDDQDQDQDTPSGYDPEVNGPAVSPAQSPTQGQAIDDVPAKLTVGEFVMPDDVVKWKGEEFFQKLISTSRETRQNIMAVHGQTQGQSHNLGGAI